MSEYLDKTGLAYLWGKIKGKLNNKADNDKYKIDTFTMTFKSGSGAQRLNDIRVRIPLVPTYGSPFDRLLPTGYHTACILALDASYTDEDKRENDISEYCHIGTTAIDKDTGKLSQKVTVYLSDLAYMSLGETLLFTLLLEKD